MQEIKGMVEAGKGPPDPALFAQTTVEKLASRIGDVVDSMDEELTQLEHKIEDGETRGVRIRLTEIRTMAAGLRRYLAPQREALDTLFRDRHPLIQGHDSAIREQADRLTRYVEDLDLAREQAILLQDELRGRVGEQQNMRMYVLALVTAVFLPLSFLTGLFGMNVGGLPGVETEDGFFWMEKTTQYLETVAFTLGGVSVTFGQLVLGPLAFIVGIFLIGWLARVLANRLAKHMGADLVHLVRRVIYIIGIVVLVITVLDLINVPLTAFAFVSGAVAIGVGFGAQNIINNFISGWILMWERPIKIGDFLELGDAKGTVESINTRSTRIRRVDGVHLMVPNSNLLENIVVNWTLMDRLARTEVRVGVSYGSPVRRVETLFYQALDEHEAILKEPKPKVIFEDFGDNALVFNSFFWVHADGDRDLRSVRSDIRFRLEELFGKDGIVVAYPQRDVHLDGSLRLLSSNETSKAEAADK
eukprot:g15657.t1